MHKFSSHGKIYIRQESTTRDTCVVTRNTCVVASARFARASASRNLLLKLTWSEFYVEMKKKRVNARAKVREREGEIWDTQLQFPYYN